jgi:DNA-binding response OmpR family regulator
MASVIKNAARKSKIGPRVLIVDDEPGMLELVSDVVGRAGNCRLLTAVDLTAAKKIIATEKIDLLLADLHLPDGNGMSLLPSLHEKHPSAATVIMTGDPSVNGAINAMRGGALDFLPKPFSADHLLDRINKALQQQAITAKKDSRLSRLRVAVKKLNTTRHTISKKVDLLCNDLVAAYGELSRQFDVIRMQESFRKLMSDAKDLEQVLCHAMDWMLRHCGYSNVAIWLASEGEEQFELGAYMKYTIPGEQPLTDALRNGLVPLINREGSVHLFGPEARDQLTPAEARLLGGQEILGCNCTYLGEGLATIVMFRDEKSPFTEEDVAMIRAISPIFAVTLATIVRQAQGMDHDDDGALLDEDEDRDRPGNKRDSDWWKRGEPPPF